MARWKDTIRNLLNLLIIACFITLFGILCGFFFGVLDPGEKAGTFFHIAGLILLISLGMKLISHYYKKPLTKKMDEEGIKEAEQKNEKQVLFEPSVGITVMFLFFIAMPVISIISQFTNNKDDFGLTIAITGVGVFFAGMWYLQPVFIFTEDSVQIKSHPFYLLGIDWKTVINYADITSVRPNMKYVGGWGGEGPEHTLRIFMNGTMKSCFLMCYDGGTIARIWLRFKEKLGDKVRLK